MIEQKGNIAVDGRAVEQALLEPQQDDGLLAKRHARGGGRLNSAVYKEGRARQ